MINEENLLFNEDHLQIETKEMFYAALKRDGIDFEDIDSVNRLPVFMCKVIKNEPAEYNKFNNTLYRLNKNKEISIVDSMTYLVEDWFEPQVLLKCLDEMNYYSLMNDLKVKYNLGKSTTTLEDFFI